MSGADDVHEVRLSPRALHDLRELRDYIASQGSPMAAESHAERLLEAIARLESFPHVGRKLGDGLRELTTVRPHLIQYEVRGLVVEVLAIRHGARRSTD